MSLTPTSFDNDFVYYELEFVFSVANNSFLRQTQCVGNNSVHNYIQLLNTSDFAVSCQSGCMSPTTNSSLLGYMNGVCQSNSDYMEFTVIKSTYKLVGDLKSSQLAIKMGPKDFYLFDWFQLNHYFENHGGFVFHLNTSLVRRPDNKLFNNPPFVLFPLITTIQQQSDYVEVFTLPKFDVDEDTLLCSKF